MKRLFLSSSFSTVSSLLPEFYGESLEGKKVAFIPTASKKEKVNFYVESGRKALLKLGLIPMELDVSGKKHSQIVKEIRKVDMIYVSGGNTFFLLQELRRSGADKAIKEAINAGMCYIGESAGSIVVAPNIEYASLLDSTAEAPDLIEYEGLNKVDIYPLPHYTNFPFKKAVEKTIALYAERLRLHPISNSQAILVNGEDVSVATKQSPKKRKA